MFSRPPVSLFSLRRLAGALLTACLGGAALAGAAVAQTAECDRLQATIASMPRGGGGGDASRYQQAAAKQRGEIGRTVAYANSLGCNKGGFLIFGESKPPQCGQIESQLQRMRGNLAQLESAAANAGGNSSEDRRRALMARYNANCGREGPPPQVAAAPRPRERGFFESLFGGGVDQRQPQQQQAYIPPQPDVTQIPLDEPPRQKPRSEAAGNGYYARGGNVAVCVRSCDGGFFPISYSAGSEDGDDLTALCAALCPNAPASVYTYGGGADIESAVSLTGQAYRALPAAFRYRTTFDSTCTCKAAGQTWVAALSEAERLLTSGGGHDVIVSEQKAAELSRPKFMPVKAKADPKLQAKADPSATAAIGALPAAPAVPAEDGQAAKEASTGAAVATASQETTGISAGDGVAAATITRDQGQTREIVVNGVRKRVRIIGPKL